MASQRTKTLRTPFDKPVSFESVTPDSWLSSYGKDERRWTYQTYENGFATDSFHPASSREFSLPKNGNTSVYRFCEGGVFRPKIGRSVFVERLDFVRGEPKPTLGVVRVVNTPIEGRKIGAPGNRRAFSGDGREGEFHAAVHRGKNLLSVFEVVERKEEVPFHHVPKSAVSATPAKNVPGRLSAARFRIPPSEKSPAPYPVPTRSDPSGILTTRVGSLPTEHFLKTGLFSTVLLQCARRWDIN